MLRWLDLNFEKALIVVVTAMMVSVLLFQVFCRYILNASISWAEELSIFGMIWLTYFGTSLAITQRRHIRVMLFSQLLSNASNKIVDILSDVIFFIFIAIATYGTMKMVIFTYNTNQTAAASGIPTCIVIAGIPLAFILCCFRLIQDILRLYKDYRIIKSGGEVVEVESAINISDEN